MPRPLTLHLHHTPHRKDAMMNYALALDLTKVYEEQFTQLYSSLRQVEQDQEYVQFIRENKKCVIWKCIRSMLLLY